MDNYNNDTKRVEITLNEEDFSLMMIDLLVERKAITSAYKMKDKENSLDLQAIRKLEEQGKPGKLLSFVNYVNKLGYKVYIEKTITENEKEG